MPRSVGGTPWLRAKMDGVEARPEPRRIMTIKIELRPDEERELRELARASGRDVSEYVHQVLGDRRELIYLPLGDSRFDSDVVLGQSLRSFQSSLNLFHLFSGNPNAVAILAVEAFHGGVVTPPGHPQGALQNHLQAVQDHTVPFLLQGRPAAFDRIVLAVVGRIVHQA